MSKRNQRDTGKSPTTPACTLLPGVCCLTRGWGWMEMGLQSGSVEAATSTKKAACWLGAHGHTIHMVMWSSSEPPWAVLRKSRKRKPGGAGESQEEPGKARRGQGVPWRLTGWPVPSSSKLGQNQRYMNLIESVRARWLTPRPKVTKLKEGCMFLNESSLEGLAVLHILPSPLLLPLSGNSGLCRFPNLKLKAIPFCISG